MSSPVNFTMAAFRSIISPANLIWALIYGRFRPLAGEGEDGFSFMVWIGLTLHELH